MSKPVTCALCGTMVDDADTVDMPAGAMCLDPCYLWLEAMMDDAEPTGMTIRFTLEGIFFTCSAVRKWTSGVSIPKGI